MDDTDDVIFLRAVPKKPPSEAGREYASRQHNRGHTKLYAVSRANTSSQKRHDVKRADPSGGNRVRARLSTTQSTSSNRAHSAKKSNSQTTRCPIKNASTGPVTPTYYRFNEEKSLPAWMVDRLVKLGWSRNAGGQELRQAVYGRFNHAGRLGYYLDAGLEYSRACEKLVPIAFKDVKCGGRFQGMTQQQVRAEVYRVMETNFGPSANNGEI